MKLPVICLLVLFLLTGNSSFSQNLTLIDSLEKKAQLADDDSVRAEAYFGIAWNYLLYDLEKARHYATKVLELTKQMGDSLSIYRAYHYWGLIHRLESSYDSSLFYFQRAVNFHTRNDLEENALQALFNMGVVYSFQGLYQKSLEHFIKALKIAEEKEDRFMTAEVLNSMGTIHKKLKNYRQSLDMTFASLQIFEALHKPFQQANCLSNIGSVYLEIKELDSALVYYQMAYEIDLEENIEWGIGHQLTNIGNVYTEKGQYLLALQYLLKGLKVREQLEQKKEIAESLAEIAKLYHLIQNNPLSINYANRAMTIAREIGERQVLRDVYHTLSKAYASTGDFKSAYRQHLAYTTLHDSILNEVNLRYINTLQAQYESEKKEKEIAWLTRDREVQEATLIRKNSTIKALLLIFVLSLLLMSVLVLFFRSRLKARELLATKNEEINQRRIYQLEQQQKIISMDAMVEGQEEERRRIAKDLHDGLGNLLANVQMQFSNVQDHMDGEKLKVYQYAHSLLDEACSEVRKIAHNMMPGALTRFGLIPAIQDMSSSIEKTKHLSFDVQVYGITKRFEEKLEIHVYRIVQELINNIIKHAHATEVLIQMAQQGDDINILVEDNGVGFDPEAARARGGLGMRSLASRVKYLDGTLEFDASPGRGTSVMVTIPTKKKKEVATYS